VGISIGLNSLNLLFFSPASLTYSKRKNIKKLLHIILISLFSLILTSCADKEEEKKEGPVLTEVYPVTTPTSDPSPNYTFSSTKAGTITYGGSCSSGTTSATSGRNTITFTTLSAGTYSDCTIIVTDSDGNASNTLAITTFVVDTTTTDTTAPTVSSVSTTTDNHSFVSITDNITVTFSEAMDTTYVTTSTSDTNCAGTIRVSSDNFSSCVKMSSEPASSNSNKTFTLDPSDNLTAGTTYKTRVTTGVKDAAGNEMNSQYETSSGFTTASSASSVTAISSHTCVVLNNASVKCWGLNDEGQLGIDNTTNMGDNSSEMAALTSINLGTGRTATAIAGGTYYSCALLDNASVKCWGRNDAGQLGIDNTTDMGDDSGEMAVLPTVNLGTGRTATAIAAGGYHNCALLDNASVKCWGANNKGQLGIDNGTNMGDNTGDMAILPTVNLGTGRTATAIAAGRGHHTCAVLDNASVKCWGYNNKGQLGIDNGTNMGDNTGDMAVLPTVNLGTGRTATAIAVGVYHSCALLDNASVKCWGYNLYGQLGIGNNDRMGDHSGEMADLPSINLGTGRTATAISAGDAHTCAVLDDASVKCWGRNDAGQLGINNTTHMGDNTGEMGDNLNAVDL